MEGKGGGRYVGKSEGCMNDGGGGGGTPEEPVNIIGELDESAPMNNGGDVVVSPFASKPVWTLV